MNIREISVSRLRDYENNPRNNDLAVEKVKYSIERFGFLFPVVVDGIVKKTAHPTNSIRQPAPDFAPTVRACAAEEGFPHWLYCVGGGYSRSRSIGRSFAGPAPAA